MEELSDIEEAFGIYLHQDWTIDGNTLEEVFHENDGFEGFRIGVKKGARLLIDSELTELELEKLIAGSWGVGYEPEVEGFENWRSALREIVRLCEAYDQEA